MSVLGTIGGIASAVGAVGSAASALGLGGNRSDGIKKQTEYALSYLHRAPSMQVYGAKKAGLHPLYVMGTGGAFSPTVSSQPARDPGAAVSHLAEGVKQFTRKKGDPVGAALETLGLRQARAETLRSEYATEMAHLELQKARQAGVSGNGVQTFAAQAPNNQVLLKLNPQGEVVDVTGMPTVEPLESYFGELGELEQSVRNYFERTRRAARKSNSAGSHKGRQIPKGPRRPRHDDYPRTGGGF